MARDVRLGSAAQGAVADDDQSRVRDARGDGPIRAQQVAESLALLQPADEEDVQVVVSQMADGSDVRVVDIEVDAVRNHAHWKVREVTVHKGARGLAYSNCAMQVTEIRLQQGPSVVVPDVRTRVRVKGPHVGSRRHPKHGHGQRGHERLMEMKDVEALVGNDGCDLVRKVKAQRDAGDRVVGRDGDGGADAVETRLVESDIRATRRREDSRLVPGLGQTPGQLADVVVHAARRREVVRGNQPNPHEDAQRRFQGGFIPAVTYAYPFQTPASRGLWRGARGGILIPPRLFTGLPPRCDAARATARGGAG